MGIYRIVSIKNHIKITRIISLVYHPYFIEKTEKTILNNTRKSILKSLVIVVLPNSSRKYVPMNKN